MTLQLHHCGYGLPSWSYPEPYFQQRWPRYYGLDVWTSGPIRRLIFISASCRKYYMCIHIHAVGRGLLRQEFNSLQLYGSRKALNSSDARLLQTFGLFCRWFLTGAPGGCGRAAGDETHGIMWSRMRGVQTSAFSSRAPRHISMRRAGSPPPANTNICSSLYVYIM